MNLSTRQQVKIKEVEREVGPTESSKTNNDSAASESQYPAIINSNIERYHFANDKLIEMSLLKVVFLNSKKEMGESIANSEKQNSSLKEREDHINISVDNKNKNGCDHEHFKRVLLATQEVVEISPKESFGSKIFGIKFVKKCPYLFKDQYGIYIFVSNVGSILGLLAVTGGIPEYLGSFILFGFPLLFVEFSKMNVKIFKMVAIQYFTILKIVYLLLFTYCGINLSENFGGYCAFIFGFFQVIVLGVFSDCFHPVSRAITMKRFSVSMFLFFIILFVFLHLGMLNISNIRIDVFGFCNLSLSNLFGSALSNLIVFSSLTLYISFRMPDKIVTFHSPITNVKMSEDKERLLRSMLMTFGENKSQVFPSAVKTLDEKLEFVIQKEIFWKSESEKYYKLLIETESKEIILKERRQTEIIKANVKTLMAASTDTDGTETTYALQAKFKPVIIDGKNTIGRMLKMEKLSKFISTSGLGIIFQIMWLVGACVTYLAMNNFIPNHYSLSVFLCLPTFSNFLMLNLTIIKILIFQFETLFMITYSLIFGICGCILVRNKDLLYVYVFFFIVLWISFWYVTLSDALPGKSGGLITAIGSLSAVLTASALLLSAYFNWSQIDDFDIPFYGSISMSVAALNTTSAFNCVLFSIKNFTNSLLHPSKMVILKGDLFLSKVTQSQLKIMQVVNEIIQLADNNNKETA